MTTLGGLVLGGLIGGTTFAIGAKAVQGTADLIKNVYHEITDEFAEHRKQKVISPLQENDDINLKLTKGERQLLAEISKSS